MTFEIKAIKTNKKGEYIGLMLNNGFMLQFKDENGKIKPFNKEFINKLCGIKEQDDGEKED